MPPNTDGLWTGATPFNVDPTTIDDGFGVTMTDTRGLFVLHAVLLHTGNVLCFSGHVEVSMYAPLYYLVDPKNSAAVISPIAFPGRPDLFCCHYVQLPDGRILAAGGSQHDTRVGGAVVYRGSEGSKTIAIFDPDTDSWTLSRTGATTHELAQGRWYPTLVALPDGRVAVFSGRREHGSGVPVPSIADDVEILSPPDYEPTTLTVPSKSLPIYPGLHLAPNGSIYYTHTNWGQEMAEPETASILIAAGSTSATWTSYAGLRPPNPRREEGMSVLLPPAQDGKILVIGGSKALKAGVSDVGVFEGPPPHGPAAFHHIENAADPRSANILDTNSNPPTWSSAGSMAFGRINGHCVLLPDATVLICGGHDNYKWLPRTPPSPGDPVTQPSLDAEIYTPGVGFRTVAGMSDPRMYHSVALLLPDGRVFTAGGANANQNELTLSYTGAASAWNVRRRYGAGMALNSKTFEFYEPPYMHNGTRPVLSDVLRNGTTTRRIEYGQEFVVTTPQAADIDLNRVALMRPGACTHHTDSEQRYVRLDATRGSGELTVTAVNDANLAPPGFYMLWIVDSQGRPCEEAVFIQLVPRPGQPGGGTTCFVATSCLGSPLHPRVLYLKALRREVRDATVAGRWFIRVVNRIYESFSPRLAERLSRDRATREVVRDLLVRPAIGVIAACDRAAARAPRFRQMLLIALLSTAAIAGVAALPVVGLAVAATLTVRRTRTRSSDASEEGSKE